MQHWLGKLPKVTTTVMSTCGFHTIIIKIRYLVVPSFHFPQEQDVKHLTVWQHMLKPTPALSPELPNPVLARELHTNHKAEDRGHNPHSIFFLTQILALLMVLVSKSRRQFIPWRADRISTRLAFHHFDSAYCQVQIELSRPSLHGASSVSTAPAGILVPWNKSHSFPRSGKYTHICKGRSSYGNCSHMLTCSQKLKKAFPMWEYFEENSPHRSLSRWAPVGV